MTQITKVLTLIVFSLLFLNLSAQEGSFENDPVAKLPDESRTFRFGLHFNPHVAWFKANTAGYKSESLKFGFGYGLTFEYFMSNNYLFSSGISILNTGGALGYKGVANVEGTNYVADELQTYKLKYIELPMLLKLRTNEIGYLTYYAQIGLKAGFNFSSKSTLFHSKINEGGPVFNSNLPSSQGDNEYGSAEINWINLYFVIGAGIEYNISGNTSLNLGITFNNGFVNQLDSKSYVLDNSGNALLDGSGKPVYSEKDASANLNYIALNIGIFF